MKRVFLSAKIKWLTAFLLLSACVDRIYFDIPPAQSLTVVEGYISDQPGPYTVNVSKGLNLDADTSVRSPLEHAHIELFDDEGNSESFTETAPGVYRTGGVIQGQLGHSYHIRMETSGGKIFESDPDSIRPVGAVEQIRYEFEVRTVETTYGEVRADVFKIFVDAQASTGAENYVRWRYKGTYKVLTFPQFHEIFSQVSAYRDPLPCSGYIITPALGGGKLEKVDSCTCCICYANQFEVLPQLSDAQLVSGNEFKNIKVGEVPINPATFFEQFLVEVEQMSLTRTSFDFFRLIRTQKEGASSLFQPPSGEIRGNVRAVNSGEAVVGLFWATSISKKSLFIPRSAVPYNLTAIDSVAEACTWYPNSSTDKPALWP
jgi:hypothetical protein